MSVVGTPLRQYLLEKRVPFECDFELTHDCNQSCVHCFLECPHPGTHADPEMVVDAMEQLAAMGCVRVGFTGGEPLLHPEFWSVLGKARSLGFAVDVTSNGQLVDGEAVQRLSDLRVKKVRLSLLGADPETHDSVTQRHGSFASALRAIGLLVEGDIPCEFACTVLPANRGQTASMEALAARLGVSIMFDWHASSSLSGRFAGVSRARGEAQQSPAVASTGDTSIRSRTGSCPAGISLLAIAPRGDVMPCVMMRRRVGNANEGVRAAWHRSIDLCTLGTSEFGVAQTVQDEVARTHAWGADAASGRQSRNADGELVCARWRDSRVGNGQHILGREERR